MKAPLFSIVAASVLAAGMGVASAQSSSTSTTTTWSNEAGTTMREYSSTRHYRSYDDPAWHAQVGMELPSSVTTYPLPDTMRVPSAERYSFGIVNNNPVVVERTTRKVIHTWE
jgi:Protein of unknown function (DUF1236)